MTTIAKELINKTYSAIWEILIINSYKFAINRLDGNDVYSFKDSKNIRRAKSLFDAW